VQQADFQRFHAVMHGMAKVYEREIDQLLLDAYWLALRDWTFPEFEQAAGQLMRSSRFMPRPADFNALRQAARPTVGEAWARVLAHASGGYRDGSGLDPVIDRAVKTLGGYRAIAMTQTDQLHWVEKRFAQHYGDMLEASETRAALGFDPDPDAPWSLPRRAPTTPGLTKL
jgi:hypothetical protein